MRSYPPTHNHFTHPHALTCSDLPEGSPLHHPPRPTRTSRIPPHSVATDLLNEGPPTHYAAALVTQSAHSLAGDLLDEVLPHDGPRLGHGHQLAIGDAGICREHSGEIHRVFSSHSPIRGCIMPRPKCRGLSAVSAPGQQADHDAGTRLQRTQAWRFAHSRVSGLSTGPGSRPSQLGQLACGHIPATAGAHPPGKVPTSRPNVDVFAPVVITPFRHPVTRSRRVMARVSTLAIPSTCTSPGQGGCLPGWGGLGRGLQGRCTLAPGWPTVLWSCSPASPVALHFSAHSFCVSNSTLQVAAPPPLEVA